MKKKLNNNIEKMNIIHDNNFNNNKQIIYFQKLQKPQDKQRHKRSSCKQNIISALQPQLKQNILQSNQIQLEKQKQLKKILQQMQVSYIHQLEKINNLRNTNETINKKIQQFKIKSYCHKNKDKIKDQNQNHKIKSYLKIQKENNPANINSQQQSKKRIINLYVKEKNQQDQNKILMIKRNNQIQLKQLNIKLESQLTQLKQKQDLQNQKHHQKISEMEKLILQYKTLCEQMLKRARSHSKKNHQNNTSLQKKNSDQKSITTRRNITNKPAQKKKLNFSGMMESQVFNIQPCTIDHLKSTLQMNKQNQMRKSNSIIHPNSLNMLNFNGRKSNKLSLSNNNCSQFNSSINKNLDLFNYKKQSKNIFQSNQSIELDFNSSKQNFRYQCDPSYIEQNSIEARKLYVNNMLNKNLQNHLNSSIGQQTSIKKLDTPQIQSLNVSYDNHNYFIKGKYGITSNYQHSLNNSISNNKLCKRQHSLSNYSLLGTKNKSYTKIITKLICESCDLEFGPTQYYKHIQNCVEKEKIKLLRQRDIVSQKLQNAFEKSILGQY